MRRPIPSALAMLVVILSAGASATRLRAQSGADPAAPASPARPTLVVLVTIDQLRADYLERFAPQLVGGLGRLARGGAVFTNAHQDHAITETAPGHASLLSGRFPRSTEIVANAVGAGDPSSRLVGSTGAGASPARFRGSTLADWLLERDERSRALSVSGKDRGAILSVGRAKAQVFWYAPASGRFTTSVWYGDTLPTWVQTFNAADRARAWAGARWTPLLPDSAYGESDSSWVEGHGSAATFPHALSPNPDAAAANLGGSPWLDELTLDFALAGARALTLGEGAQTDLLAISLSATDAIGHRFGPDSKEIHDQVVRLDRRLGVFLDSLFARVDSTRVVVALTADHGVSRFAGLVEGEAASKAAWVDLSAALRAARDPVRRAGIDTLAVALDHGMLLMDASGLARAGVSPTFIVERFTKEALKIPGVLRVDRVRALPKLAREGDAIARRWLHSIPPRVPAEAVVTLTPYSVWGEQMTAIHGSPHDEDTHVALVLWGAGVRPGRVDDFVRTVDIAPTLARLAGVEPAEKVDGVVLERALK
jgi:predicted AlkP superfamily pyrophosphatase or phosphodiesterase